MQALLSQQLATDIAMKGAAVGGEQAKAYGGIQSNIGNVLAQLSASGDPMSKLLAGLMQTQMDVAGRERVAQIGADSNKSLNMPTISYAAAPSATVQPVANSTLGSWYNPVASSMQPGGSSTSRW
jgi:hypothetical protein